MGKQNVILESQIIDPRSLCNASWDAIDDALLKFKSAMVEHKQNTIKRLTLRSRTDQAVLGNLLLKKREQIAQSPSEAKETGQHFICNTGMRPARKRNAEGHFSSSSGFQKWVKSTFSFDLTTAYRYMNMAENIGLGVNKQVNFVLAPSVQAHLRRTQKQLYLKPSEFRVLLKKEELCRRNGKPDQTVKNHLFIRDSLVEMRSTMGRIAFCLCEATPEDFEEVEAFLKDSLKQIRGIRKESGADE